MNLIFLSLILTACKKNQSVESAGELGYAVTTAQPGAMPAHVERMMGNFERVHFDTDSSTLNEESKNALARNAKIMVEHPDLTIEVQGHCDERGTTEYNIALGDRRAAAVRETLISQGVAPSRIVAVSYGEEMPLAMGAVEEAWSQNRRAEFRVTWDDGTVQ